MLYFFILHHIILQSFMLFVLIPGSLHGELFAPCASKMQSQVQPILQPLSLLHYLLQPLQVPPLLLDL